MSSVLLHSDVPVDDNKKIWQMKIALKIKVFTWYLRRSVILTKNNLVKRNWDESTKCMFCPQQETIKLLIFKLIST